MNVRPDQLGARLQKQIHPVYLITGDEPLQLMECADLVRSHCRQQGYSERDVIDVDAGFDWQSFNEQAGSLSLFAERRILDVRLPTARPGRQGGQAIKEYLQHPPDDTVLLISAGKLETSSRNSAWYKAIDRAGIVVPCWPVKPAQLPAWLQQRFKQHDMSASPEVLDVVCQHVEGNLLAAAQEVDKLHLLLGPGTVNIDQVRRAVSDNSRFNVFELVDSALAGERNRVMKILSGLRAEGVEPVLVTWALARDIRLLAAAAGQASATEFALSRAGVWQSRMPLFRACLARHKKPAIMSLLKGCAHLDAISKGFRPGQVWDELRSLVFRLSK